METSLSENLGKEKEENKAVVDGEPHLNSDDVPIESLNLSVRSFNALKNYGIKSLSELKKLSVEDLYKIRNLGKKSVTEITKNLESSSSLNVNELEKKDMRDLLSVRSYNVLTKHGITSLAQLKEIPIDEIEKFPHLGAKSIAEIKRLFKKRLFNNIEWNVDYSIRDNFIYCISKSVFIKDADIQVLHLATRSARALAEINITHVSDIVPFSNADFSKLNSLGSRSIDDIKTKVLNYLKNPDNELNIETQIKTIIEGFKFDGCNKTVVFDKLNAIFDSAEIEKTLNDLIQNQVLFEYEGKLFYRYVSFPQFLYKLEKSIDKDIMFRRINGETLEEIGKSYNISRERIRQKQRKFVEKNIGDISNPIHIFREDRFRHIFENYDLGRKEFCKIFGEKERTYNYLIMRYERGTKKISEASDDILIPNRLKGLMLKYNLRNCILIDGEYIEKNRKSLVTCFFKKNRQTFKIKDLIQAFNQFINTLQLENPEKYTFDERYMSHFGLDDCVLLKYPSSVRYYDYYSFDYSELIEEIDLTAFKNIQISTLKLFNNYPSLMEKYDIKDEYELHSILRKYYEDNPNDRISFRRMPIIQIDDFDRNAYIINLWKTNGCLSYNKLSKIISEETGIKASVALAVWITNSELPLLAKEINNTPLSEDEKVYLTDNLKKAFYWLSDIKKISASYSNELSEKIDSVNMMKVGYHLYSQYAIRNPLKPLTYFKSILLEKDTFCFSDFLEYNKTISVFYNIFSALQHELEIIGFENNMYITCSKLSQFGYGKEKLREIGNTIKQETENMNFFSVHSLRNNGIDFEIDELGFNDKIIESIIKYTTDIKYIAVLNNYLFSPKKFSFIDVIADELHGKGKISTDDLIESINEKYGLVITKEYIMKFIKDSAFYYDSIMDSFYESYKDYLEDICQ